VRKRREDLHPSGWGALVVGALLSAASVALFVDGANGIPSGRTSRASPVPVLEVVSGVVLGIPALALDISGIAMVTAPGGYDERIGP
jgi:hypothetical protein